MKRHYLFFLLALLVFLLWMFPHRVLVERLLLPRARLRGLSIHFVDVTPTWPPGYNLDKPRLASGPYRVALDRARVLFGFAGIRRVDADGCSGAITVARTKDDAGPSVTVLLQNVDPADCLEIDELRVSGAFSGRIDIAFAREGSAIGTRMVLDGRGGEISGLLPSSRRPIGAWTFSSLHVEGQSQGETFTVDGAQAEAEGLAWEVDGLRITRGRTGSVVLYGNLRARRNDDSKRSKAILGLLPKAPAHADGWHYYRIAGTLDSPRILALP